MSAFGTAGDRACQGSRLPFLPPCFGVHEPSESADFLLARLLNFRSFAWGHYSAAY